MPEITAADIVSIVYPGLELNDTVTTETLKEELGKRYKSVELSEREKTEAQGNAFGLSQTKFKQVLADMDISPEEYKELKKVDEFADMASKKVKAMKEELANLKELSKGTGKETEKILEYQTKLKGMEDLLNKANETIGTWESKFNTSESEWKQKYESEKLNDEVDRLFSEANWTDDSDKVVKEGVKRVFIDGKYQFKREGGKILVYKADGTIETDGTTQMTAQRLFELKLKEAKRFKENAGNQGGKGSEGAGHGSEAGNKSQKQLAYEAEQLKKLGVK